MSISRTQFLRQSTFMLGGVVLGNKLFAGNARNLEQVLDTYHPMDCTWNFTTDNIYNNVDYTTQIGISTFNYSKTPPLDGDVQYEDENENPMFTTTPCKPIIEKCDNTDKSDKNTLRYIAFYPLSTVHNYALKPLPVFVIYHAGGYADCSGADNDDQNNTVALALARKGFIVISVEYRRGRILDNTPINSTYPQGFSTAQQELAAYRAQQDGRGAIRTIMQRNGGGHGNLFYFNPAQFFVGGFSAGAGIANGVCYYNNQSMINQVFPNSPSHPTPTIQDALGNLQADYYADGAYDPANWPTIRGLMNCWGGLGVPTANETNLSAYLQAAIPTIGFQGYMDNVVWFDNLTHQKVFYSSSNNNTGTFHFDWENRCTLTYPNKFYVKTTKIPNDVPDPVVTILCTKDFHCYLISKNKLAEIYVDTTMKHGIMDSNDSFGLPIPATKTQVWNYIAQRVACFFQAIMNGKTTYGSTGKAVFVDCVNNRGGCSWTSNNECSTDPVEATCGN